MRDFVHFVLGGILCLASLAWVAWGATYNFYFNNTEQGNNSTATPNVTVNDGKVSSVPSPLPTVSASALPAAPATVSGVPAATPAPSPVAEGQSSLAKLEAAHDDLPRENPRFRFTGSAFFGQEYRRHPVSSGAMAGLAYSLSKGVAFNLFAGKGDFPAPFGGFEAELVPFRISVGRLADAVETALVFGGSTLMRSRSNWFTAHLGLRATLNLFDHWGLTVAGRGNAGYQMVEAGLAIRL